jgi:hypothetical protein
MEKTFNHEDIEQILAEAEDLLLQINPEIIEYMEEEGRLQFEQYAQNLKQLKSELRDKVGKGETSESSSYGEGVHEAMDEIVKAMKGLASYLS